MMDFKVFPSATCIVISVCSPVRAMMMCGNNHTCPLYEIAAMVSVLILKVGGNSSRSKSGKDHLELLPAKK